MPRSSGSTNHIPSSFMGTLLYFWGPSAPKFFCGRIPRKWRCVQCPGGIFPPCTLLLTASGKTGPSFGEDSAPSWWKTDFIGEFQGKWSHCWCPGRACTFPSSLFPTTPGKMGPSFAGILLQNDFIGEFQGRGAILEFSLPVPLDHQALGKEFGKSNGEAEIWEGTVKQERSVSSCIPVPVPPNS